MLERLKWRPSHSAAGICRAEANQSGARAFSGAFREILPSSVSAGVVMEVFCSESQKKLVVIHPTNAYRKGS